MVNQFVESTRRQPPRAPEEPESYPNRQERVDEHPAREVDDAQRHQ